MSNWPRYPTIYEINTWVWLSDLSQKYGKPVNLGTVPSSEWDAIEKYGFDAVWLMGVWERSPAGIAVANANEGLIADFRRALPDFRTEDNVGSPYCVRQYIVDPHLGGPTGLAVARQQLARRGMKLLLDLVPNHVAPDHPWVSEHPEYFVQGSAEDLSNDPSAFFAANGSVLARGRDPFFPPWPDVLQLNAFDPGLRKAMAETIDSIAAQCDGIRCDMAMLLLNAIFERTWGRLVGQHPPTEYWTDLIYVAKRAHRDFIFIAEAYWDLEWELQQKGFDFCYDKRLYDRLEHENAESVRLHLCAALDYQERLLRFIENHDEPRAAATFSPEKERTSAVTTSTVPGARLFHEGQFEGRKVRVPVFLGRRPEEPGDADLQNFYRRLLAALANPIVHEGKWSLCDRSGWPDNQSFQNLVAWKWVRGVERSLIVVNLSSAPVQARIHVGDDFSGGSWNLKDALSDVRYEREADEMVSQGLYVELGPWQCQIFEGQRVPAATASRKAA